MWMGGFVDVFVFEGGRERWKEGCRFRIRRKGGVRVIGLEMDGMEVMWAGWVKGSSGVVGYWVAL